MLKFTTSGAPFARGRQQGRACGGLALGMTGIHGPMLEEDGLLSLDALHTILSACATVGEALASDRAPAGAICQGGEDGLFTDFRVLFSAAGKRFHYAAGWPDYADAGTVRLD